MSDSPSSLKSKATSPVRGQTYGKLCTEVYDLDKPAAPAQALEFYLRHARSVPGPVLEPMCGSGRFLLPFAKQGLEVIGTDLSEHMLQACRQLCERHGVSAPLHRLALHQMDLGKPFGFIFIPAGSFCLIVQPDEVRASLASLRKHLAAEGKLMLEIITPHGRSAAPGRWCGKTVTRPDGSLIVCSSLSSYDEAAKCEQVLCRYESIAENRLNESEYEVLHLRYYDAAEISALLSESGFRDVRLFKPYEDSPPAGDAKSIVVEART